MKYIRESKDMIGICSNADSAKSKINAVSHSNNEPDEKFDENYLYYIKAFSSYDSNTSNATKNWNFSKHDDPKLPPNGK